MTSFLWLINGSKGFELNWIHSEFFLLMKSSHSHWILGKSPLASHLDVSALINSWRTTAACCLRCLPEPVCEGINSPVVWIWESDCSLFCLRLVVTELQRETSSPRGVWLTVDVSGRWIDESHRVCANKPCQAGRQHFLHVLKKCFQKAGLFLQDFLIRNDEPRSHLLPPH